MFSKKTQPMHQKLFQAEGSVTVPGSTHTWFKHRDITPFWGLHMMLGTHGTFIEGARFRKG